MKLNPPDVLLFIVCFFLFSCTEKPIFQVSKSVGNFWHKDSIVCFDFEIHDTLQAYNLFLKLKANNDYPFSNIFLITSIESPNEQIKRDTIEYLMTSVEGKILGNGFLKNKESKLWFKEKYYFSKIGKHTVSIQHSLRKRGEIDGIEKLEGISEIGLNVERYK